MPCRSDYMEPTHRELQEEKELRESVQFLGDKATYACDMLREYLLGNLTEKEIMLYVNLPLSPQLTELEERNSKLYSKVDKKLFTKVFTMLHEYEALNVLAQRLEPPTKKQLAQIEKNQIQHREDDLSRLMKTFAEKGDRVRLRKVLDADNTKPLEPQLGFSPDAF